MAEVAAVSNFMRFDLLGDSASSDSKRVTEGLYELALDMSFVVERGTAVLFNISQGSTVRIPIYFRVVTYTRPRTPTTLPKKKCSWLLAIFGVGC